MKDIIEFSKSVHAAIHWKNPEHITRSVAIGKRLGLSPKDIVRAIKEEIAARTPAKIKSKILVDVDGLKFNILPYSRGQEIVVQDFQGDET